jgi:hypothetical protein
METLEKLYNDPRYGLSSSKLYKKAKEIDPTVTHSLVKKFLKDQELNQIFKQRKVKHFYPLIATGVFQRLQTDLQDMVQENSVVNKKYKWIFCAIDVFTRYAFCYPQRDKTEKSCLESLRKLIADVNKKGFNIQQIDSDKESAFLSRQYRKVCTDNGITQNLIEPIQGKHSMGVVERFNKTIRSLINQYKAIKKTGEWIEGLPDLVANYNETEHRTLGRSPEEAVKTGKGIIKYMIQQTLKADEQSYNKEDIKVGDHVRLKLKKSLFEKGTKEQWTKTTHKVSKIEKREIYVDDRTHPYTKETVMKVDKVEHLPTISEEEKVNEQQVKEQKKERKLKKEMNKEGVDINLHEKTEEEKNERAIRGRKQRDFGPYYRYG